MGNYAEKSEDRLKYIKSLYKLYPVLEKIDINNDGIIRKEVIFKTIHFDEYVNLAETGCIGVLFVIKGTIKIQKVNEDGNETNLYNIKQGEFCHEALSCLSKLESLKITGKAMETSKICLIPSGIVQKYCFQDKEFLLYMYKDLYNKFNYIIENKEEIIHEDLESRLIRLLINKNSKVIYATHSQLAFEIDSVREVVSRKLKNIEKRGYIKLERGKVVILKDLNEILQE